VGGSNTSGGKRASLGCPAKAAALWCVLCAQLWVGAPGAGLADPVSELSHLIAHIEDGANAGHIKYRYLMRGRPGWPSRAEVLSRLKETLEVEKNQTRRMLLRAAIAYGLARGGSSDEAVSEYLELLDQRNWPASEAGKRGEVVVDLLMTPQIADNIRSDNPHLLSAVREYLMSDGEAGERLLPFGLFALRNRMFKSRVTRTISEVYKAREEDYFFLKRAAHFYMQARDTKRALSCLTDAWKVVPDGDGEKRWVGVNIRDTLVSAGQYGAAIEFQQKLIQALTNASGESLQLARLHRLKGDQRQMLASIEQELSAEPANRTRLAAVNLLIETENADKALSLLESVNTDDLTPDESYAVRLASRLLTGMALAANGESERAQQFLAEANHGHDRQPPLWVLPYIREARKLIETIGAGERAQPDPSRSAPVHGP